MISNNEIVLVVENDYSVCLSVAELLESYGFVAFTAVSAEEAVKFLNSTENIDLMVTDIDLGSPLNGFDLARSARRMIPNLPIVYITGSASVDKLLYNNSKFLLKPYTNESLLTVIRELLHENSTINSSTN